ncbi:response regulator [Paenibacillaceae bacterium WGS1546]|uniref:response regulator transcription factor n=1 Tax=Cohnella sp. WGS1546 TaxID=3366810 RepID=UPI00372CF2E4
MKALIVDDEEHVREAIELSVDWEKYGISERLMAEDGVQATELIRLYNPEILFCDMKMPNMDGTELLRWLREEYEEMQVIVISGHDDFRYTRAAIRAWGVDYLLKPFRKRDLENALERAATAWRLREASRQENRKAEYRVKQADGLLDEQRLATFLKGEISPNDGLRSLLHKMEGVSEGVWVALALPRNRIEIVNGRFDGDAELFMFAVNNIAEDILKSYGSYYFCRLDPYQWALLISEVGNGSLPQRPASELQDRLHRLAEAWRLTLGLSVFVGLTAERASVDKLPGAVGDARVSLLRSMVLDNGLHSAAVSAAPRLSDKQVLLEAALSGGNKSYAREIIGSFVQAIRERGVLSLKELQAFTLEANHMLERASRLIAGGNKVSELYLPLWISDLEEWERLLVQHWWRMIEESGREGSGNHGIESLREYMSLHFQEDISLSSLSESFHFSPQYIAKKFKELYNTTVMTYLTEIRIDKARSLLAHTAMTVLEISVTVGYADENYFGKVFKKQTGLSPLQYRKQAQRSERAK